MALQGGNAEHHALVARVNAMSSLAEAKSFRAKYAKSEEYKEAVRDLKREAKNTKWAGRANAEFIRVQINY